MKEKDLEIYDLFMSPNRNLFIKMTEDHSIAIGPKGSHGPHDWDLDSSQYVKRNDVCNVRKVGRLVFDAPKKVSTTTKLPQYVSLDGTALRLRGNEYFRDGGNWSVQYRLIGGVLHSWSDRKLHPQLHRRPLVEISEAMWRTDNGQYVND